MKSSAAQLLKLPAQFLAGTPPAALSPRFRSSPKSRHRMVQGAAQWRTMANIRITPRPLQYGPGPGCSSTPEKDLRPIWNTATSNRLIIVILGSSDSFRGCLFPSVPPCHHLPSHLKNFHHYLCPLSSTCLRAGRFSLYSSSGVLTVILGTAFT